MTNLKGGIQGYTISGATKLDPDKTVNYVTCHDNYTLYDRFKAAGITDEDTVKKMAMLANSVVFTSQGTTFMLAGEEFLRTKGGNHNSYNATYEVNELNYELKVDHLDMFKNYQKLIALKQNLDGLHLDGTKVDNLRIENRDSNNTLLYKLNDETNGKEYIVIHTNGVNPSSRGTIDLTGYTVYLDTLGELEGELGQVTPKAFQTIIAYKNK
jgi:pullulanase